MAMMYCNLILSQNINTTNENEESEKSTIYLEFSFEAGTGLSRYHSMEVSQKYPHKWGGIGGVHIELKKKHPKKFHCSYSLGLQFQQKGNIYNDITHVKNNYLTVPAMVRGNYRSFSFLTGVYSSILLSYTKNDDVYGEKGLNPIDYGLLAGIGCRLSPRFDLKTTYDIGFGRVYSYKKFHAGGSAYNNFHYYNRSFFFSIEYYFWGRNRRNVHPY